MLLKIDSTVPFKYPPIIVLIPCSVAVDNIGHHANKDLHDDKRDNMTS